MILCWIPIRVLRFKKKVLKKEAVPIAFSLPVHFQNSEEPPEVQQNPTRKLSSASCDAVEVLSSSLFGEGDDVAVLSRKLSY